MAFDLTDKIALIKKRRELEEKSEALSEARLVKELETQDKEATAFGEVKSNENSAVEGVKSGLEADVDPKKVDNPSLDLEALTKALKPLIDKVEKIYQALDKLGVIEEKKSKGKKK